MGNEILRLITYSLGGVIVGESLLLALALWRDHRGHLRSLRPVYAVLLTYALAEVVPNTLLVVRADVGESLIVWVLAVKVILVVGLGFLIVEVGKRLRGERRVDEAFEE